MTTPAPAGSSFTVGRGEKYNSISAVLSDMKDGDVCIVEEGVYRECISVPQNHITLRGVGRVVITGCDKAGKASPTKINGHDGLMFEVGKPVYDSFRGEHYLQQARFPNKTMPMTSNEDCAFTTIEENGDVTFQEEGLELPKDLSGGHFVGMGSFKSWYRLTLPITGVQKNGSLSIDEANASSGYMGKYGLGKGLGYIIDARAVLDTPGEWHSDGKQNWTVTDIANDFTMGEPQLHLLLRCRPVRAEKVDLAVGILNGCSAPDEIIGIGGCLADQGHVHQWGVGQFGLGPSNGCWRGGVVSRFGSGRFLREEVNMCDASENQKANSLAMPDCSHG